MEYKRNKENITMLKGRIAKQKVKPVLSETAKNYLRFRRRNRFVKLIPLYLMMLPSLAFLGSEVRKQYRSKFPTCCQDMH